MSGIQWEPLGGVREYKVHARDGGTGSVEYLAGAADAPPPTCGGPVGANDLTGRLRRLRVTRDQGASVVFERTYDWTANQLAEEATCLLPVSTGVAPRREKFVGEEDLSYDDALQLRHVSRPPGEYSSKGGAYGRRDYAFDTRGNRTSDRADCWCFQSSFGSGNGVDALMSRVTTSTPTPLPTETASCSCSQAPSAFRQAWGYDSDGRVNMKHGPLDLVMGDPKNVMNFDAALDGAHAAIGAVYRAVNVNGHSWEYFYDAAGRRVRKKAPDATGDRSTHFEYYYDGTKLLEDRGVNQLPAPTEFPIDEYIWLDGKPVAMLKSQFTASGAGWERKSDFGGSCTRVDEEAVPCGRYFIVNDYLPKPVVMLNSDLRVAGVGDYDPFGHVNRPTYIADTAHPYTPNKQMVLAYISQPRPDSRDIRMLMRGRFAAFETSPPDVVILSRRDRTYGEHRF